MCWFRIGLGRFESDVERGIKKIRKTSLECESGEHTSSHKRSCCAKLSRGEDMIRCACMRDDFQMLAPLLARADGDVRRNEHPENAEG